MSEISVLPTAERFSSPRPKAQPPQEKTCCLGGQLHEFLGRPARASWRSTQEQRLEGATIAPSMTAGTGATRPLLDKRTRETVGPGVPIAMEKKPTNSAQGPRSTGFFVLETRLRGLDSRTRIRVPRSRKILRSRRKCLAFLGKPSLERTSLNNCHPEARWFFLHCYRNPDTTVDPAMKKGSNALPTQPHLSIFMISGCRRAA